MLCRVDRCGDEKIDSVFCASLLFRPSISSCPNNKDAKRHTRAFLHCGLWHGRWPRPWLLLLPLAWPNPQVPSPRWRVQCNGHHGRPPRLSLAPSVVIISRNHALISADDEEDDQSVPRFGRGHRRRRYRLRLPSTSFLLDLTNGHRLNSDARSSFPSPSFPFAFCGPSFLADLSTASNYARNGHGAAKLDFHVSRTNAARYFLR